MQQGSSAGPPRIEMVIAGNIGLSDDHCLLMMMNQALIWCNNELRCMFELGVPN